MLYKNNKNVNFVRLALTAVFMTGVVGGVWGGDNIAENLGSRFIGLKQEWGTPGKTDIVVVEDGARPEMYDGSLSRNFCGKNTNLQPIRRSIVVPNRMGKYERDEALPTYMIGGEAFQERVILAPDMLEGYVLLLFQPYEFMDNPVRGMPKVVKFPDENSNGVLNTTLTRSDKIDFWICGNDNTVAYNEFISGNRTVDPNDIGIVVVKDNAAGSFSGMTSSEYRKLWTDYLNVVNFKYEKFVFVKNSNGGIESVRPGVVVRYGSLGSKKTMYAMYGVWTDEDMAKKYGFKYGEVVYFSDNKELLPVVMDEINQIMTVQGSDGRSGSAIDRVYRYGGQVFTEAQAKLNMDKLAWRSRPYHSRMDYNAGVDEWFGDFRDTLNFLSDNMYGVLGNSLDDIIMEYRKRLNGRDDFTKVESDRFKREYFLCSTCGGIGELTGLDALFYTKPAAPNSGGQGLNIGLLAGYPDPIFYWVLFKKGILEDMRSEPETFSNLSDYLNLEHFINNSLHDYYDPTLYGVDNKRGENLSQEDRERMRYMQVRGAVNTETPPWGARIFDRETGKLLSQKYQAYDPTMGTNWNLIGMHREEQQFELDNEGNPNYELVVYDTLFEILEKGKGFLNGYFDKPKTWISDNGNYGRMVKESDLMNLYGPETKTVKSEVVSIPGTFVHKCNLCKNPLKYGGHGMYRNPDKVENTLSLNEKGNFLHGLMLMGSPCGINLEFLDFMADGSYCYINDYEDSVFTEEVIVDYVPVWSECGLWSVFNGETNTISGTPVKARIVSIRTLYMYEKTESYTFGYVPWKFWGNMNTRWPYDPRRKDLQGNSYTKGYRGGRMPETAKNRLPYVTCDNKDADVPGTWKGTQIRTGYGDITGRVDTLRAEINWDFENFFKDFKASDTIDGQYWKDKFPTAESIAEANVMKLYTMGYFFERALENNVAWDFFSDSGWYIGNPQNAWLPYSSGLDMFIHNEDYQDDQNFIPVFQLPDGGMVDAWNIPFVSEILGIFQYHDADFFNGAVFKTMLKWPIVYYDASNTLWILGYMYTRPRMLAHFVVKDNFVEDYDYSQDPPDEDGFERQFWYYNARFLGKQSLQAWNHNQFAIGAISDGKFWYAEHDDGKKRPAGNIYMDSKIGRGGFWDNFGKDILESVIIPGYAFLNAASILINSLADSWDYKEGVKYPLKFVSPRLIGNKSYATNEYLTLMQTVFPDKMTGDCEITRTTYQRADEVYAQKDLATDLEELDERPDGWPNEIEKQKIWEIVQLILWGEGINAAMKGLYWLFTESGHPAVEWTAGVAYAAGQRVESYKAVQIGITVVKEGWRLYKEIQMSLDLINDIMEKWEDLGYAWEGLRTTALYLYEYYSNFKYDKEHWWRVTQLLPIGSIYAFEGQLRGLQDMNNAFVKTFDNMGIFLDSSHMQQGAIAAGYYIQQGTIAAWDLITKRQVEELMIEIPMNGIQELSFAGRFAQAAEEASRRRQSGGEKFWSIGTGMAVEYIKKYRLHALTNGMLAINMVLSTAEREANDWVEFHGYINRAFNPAALDTLEWITMGRSYHSDWVTGMTYDGDSIGRAIDTFKWKPSMRNIRNQFRTPSGLFEQDLYTRLSPIGDYDYWAAPGMWDFVTVDKGIQARQKMRKDKKKFEAYVLREQSYQKYVQQKEAEREKSVNEYIDSIYRVVPYTISPDPIYTNEEWEVIVNNAREREIQKYKEQYDNGYSVRIKSDVQTYVDKAYDDFIKSGGAFATSGTVQDEAIMKQVFNKYNSVWDSLVSVPFTGHPEGGY